MPYIFSKEILPIFQLHPQIFSLKQNFLYPGSIPSPKPEKQKNPPWKKIYIFQKKYAPKNVLYFATKPDFTYYPNSPHPLNNFLYFLIKPRSYLGQFPVLSLKKFILFL